MKAKHKYKGKLKLIGKGGNIPFALDNNIPSINIPKFSIPGMNTTNIYSNNFKPVESNVPIESTNLSKYEKYNKDNGYLPTKDVMDDSVIRKEINIKQQIAEQGISTYKREEEQLKKYKKNAEQLKDVKVSSVDNVNNLNNLSEEDIKVVQKDLVNKGFLKTSTPISENNYKSKETIILLQKKLKSEGYDLGKYGINKDGIDGILGSKTKKAIVLYNQNKEIDGKVGNNTRQAFKDYKLSVEKNTSKIANIPITTPTKDSDILTVQKDLEKTGYFKAKSNEFNYNTDNIVLRDISNKFEINKDTKTESKECTYYVGKEIEKKIGVKGREKIGMYGDAWTITDNLQGTEIYNVFPKNKPIVTNPDRYINKITENRPNISSNNVKDGDIVTMYYGGSSNAEKAYKKGGRTFSTHAGIIKIDNNNNKYIEHNIGGTIHRESLDDFLNNKVTNEKGLPIRITSITRPNYKLPETQEVYDNTQNTIDFNNVTKVSTPLGKKESAIFNQVVLNNKDKLLKDIPINENEFNNLTKALKVIGWKESRYEVNPKSTLKTIGSEVREKIGGREASIGYTQLKDKENIDETLRSNLKVSNESLEIPEKAAIPSFYSLSTKYLAIKKALENTNFTEDDVAQLALISWNEPINKVIETAKKYGNLDNTIKAYKDSYGYDKHGETLFPYDKAVIAYNKYLSNNKIVNTNSTSNLKPIEKLAYGGMLKINDMKKTKTYKKLRKGGKLIPIGNGGDIPPYYTSDPNDPRIKGYNDSLAIYNFAHNAALRELKENYQDRLQKYNSNPDSFNKKYAKYYTDPNTSIMTRIANRSYTPKELLIRDLIKVTQEEAKTKPLRNELSGDNLHDSYMRTMQQMASPEIKEIAKYIRPVGQALNYDDPNLWHKPEQKVILQQPTRTVQDKQLTDKQKSEGTKMKESIAPITGNTKNVQNAPIEYAKSSGIRQEQRPNYITKVTGHPQWGEVYFINEGGIPKAITKAEAVRSGLQIVKQPYGYDTKYAKGVMMYEQRLTGNDIAQMNKKYSLQNNQEERPTQPNTAQYKQGGNMKKNKTYKKLRKGGKLIPIYGNGEEIRDVNLDNPNAQTAFSSPNSNIGMAQQGDLQQTSNIPKVGMGSYGTMIQMANQLQDTTANKYYDPNKGYYEDSAMGKLAAASEYGNPDKALMANVDYIKNISSGKDVSTNVIKMGANLLTGGSSEMFGELIPIKTGVDYITGGSSERFGKLIPFDKLGISKNDAAKSEYEKERDRVKRMELENEKMQDAASLHNNPQYSKGYKTDFLYGTKGGLIPIAKSGIYIKPENRGKFNALKKRTGKTTEELTHSNNPLTRKRAIFAQNAAKWRKANGGSIDNPIKVYSPNTKLTPQEEQAFQQQFNMFNTHGAWNIDNPGYDYRGEWLNMKDSPDYSKQQEEWRNNPNSHHYTIGAPVGSVNKWAKKKPVMFSDWVNNPEKIESTKLGITGDMLYNPNTKHTTDSEGNIISNYNKGGKLIKIAPDVKKVVNAGTHESGKDIAVSVNGNKVAKTSPKATALVENGEVIHGRHVMSERDGYADLAEVNKNSPKMLKKIFNVQEESKVMEGNGLNACHGKKLKKMQVGGYLPSTYPPVYNENEVFSNYWNDPNRRNDLWSDYAIETLRNRNTNYNIPLDNAPVTNLWEHKPATTIDLSNEPVMQYRDDGMYSSIGEKIKPTFVAGDNEVSKGKVGSKLIPIGTNVSNKIGQGIRGINESDALNYGAIATSLISSANTNKQLKKIKIPLPRLYKHSDISTDLNYEPDRAAIRDAVNRSNASLDSSISSSAQRNIFKTTTNLEGAKALSPIYSQERNAEAGLRNANIQDAQMIANLNRDKLGQYDEMKRLKKVSEIERTNQLGQNVADRMINISNYLQTKDYQNAYLKVQEALGADTPSFYRLSDVFSKPDDIKGVWDTPEKRKVTYKKLGNGTAAQKDFEEMMKRANLTDYK